MNPNKMKQAPLGFWASIRSALAALRRSTQEGFLWLGTTWPGRMYQAVDRRTGDGLSMLVILLVVVATVFLLIWAVISPFQSPEKRIWNRLPQATWSVTKAVACYPIKLAAECCLPGYTGESPTVHRFRSANQDQWDNEWRAVVVDKSVVEPRYSVRPRIDWEYRGVCGKTRYSLGGYPDDVEITVSPRETQYVVAARGDAPKLRLTKPTWDRVRIGDVIIGRGAFVEEGLADGPEDLVIRGEWDVTRNANGYGEWVNDEVRSRYSKLVEGLVNTMNVSDYKRCLADQKAIRRNEDEE